MDFLDKLERKFGRYALRNLMSYIILGNAIIFLLVNLGFAQLKQFVFWREYIMQGEWWRILTFLFIPETIDLLWFIFSAMMYYFVGNALEQVWGSFKFNMYYLVGALGTMLIAFIFGMPADAHYISLSLFLGFATLFPDMEFRLYFLIPIKAKYLAILYFIFLAYSMVTGGPLVILLILVSLLNYLLFFGLPTLKRIRRKKHGMVGQKNYKVAKREIEKGSKAPIKVAFHRCHVCGKTEIDNPEMEFRYCSSCKGDYEYCMEHLKNHTHIE